MWSLRAPSTLLVCDGATEKAIGTEEEIEKDREMQTQTHVAQDKRPRETWEDLAERLDKIQADREIETETESRRGTQRMSEETEEPGAWEERQVRRLPSLCRALPCPSVRAA